MTKVEPEIPQNHWTKWFTNLPASQIKEYRDKITTACGCSLQVFKQWRLMYNKVPFLAQEKIREIAKRSDLDFTFYPKKRLGSEVEQPSNQ